MKLVEKGRGDEKDLQLSEIRTHVATVARCLLQCNKHQI